MRYTEEQLRMHKIAGIVVESINTPSWLNTIRGFITSNISDDEKELYLVIKALEKTLESFKEEMGEFDPNFHYSK